MIYEQLFPYSHIGAPSVDEAAFLIIATIKIQVLEGFRPQNILIRSPLDNNINSSLSKPSYPFFVVVISEFNQSTH